jgi:hypothetical protein
LGAGLVDANQSVSVTVLWGRALVFSGTVHQNALLVFVAFQVLAWNAFLVNRAFVYSNAGHHFAALFGKIAFQVPIAFNIKIAFVCSKARNGFTNPKRSIAFGVEWRAIRSRIAFIKAAALNRYALLINTSQMSGSAILVNAALVGSGSLNALATVSNASQMVF